MLPALLPLLAPQLRPVAERLLNPGERRALGAVTHTMLAYGVRFDQRSAGVAAAAAAAGRPPVTHLPLNPPVDRFCAFKVRLEPPPANPEDVQCDAVLGLRIQ